jgi:hypothetical protein
MSKTRLDAVRTWSCTPVYGQSRAAALAASVVTIAIVATKL